MSAYGSRAGWMISDDGCRHCDNTDDWPAAVAMSLLPPTVLQSVGHSAERMLYCADAPSVAYVEAETHTQKEQYLSDLKITVTSAHIVVRLQGHLTKSK